VVIGVDLRGGDIGGAAPMVVDQSGYIQADHIAAVTVNGSIIAGRNTSTNPASQLTRSGSVRAVHDLVSLTVRGSLVGSATNAVVISAAGQAAPSRTADVAIGSLTVGGRVK